MSPEVVVKTREADGALKSHQRVREWLRGVHALVSRDLHVARRHWGVFLTRVLTQPLLILFVFGYVMPRISRGQLYDPAVAVAVITPGVIGLSMVITAILAIGLPMVLEIAVTGSLDDRLGSPASMATFGLAKVVSGILQAGLAGLLVVPFIYLLPDAVDVITYDPWIFVSVMVLGAWFSSSAGLLLGTAFNPVKASVAFGVIAVPVAFLGAVYYQWAALDTVRWVQIVCLANPLVYINEGLRAGMTDLSHMPLWAVYGVLVPATVVTTVVAIRRFRNVLVP